MARRDEMETTCGRYSYLDAPTNMVFAKDVRRQKLKAPVPGKPSQTQTINASGHAAGVPIRHLKGRGYSGRSSVEEDL